MRQLVYLFFSCFSILAYGQNQGNIWYFGYGAGLDFNSGTPTVITDGQTGGLVPHVEGTSVISDSTGSLLFYTDGEKVWNSDHQLMPNGTGLLGLYSSTQSALIVPAPVDPDRYFYIFTVGVGGPVPTYHTNAHYSVVDICLENGKGDVQTNQKNILLGDTLPEKLVATRHSNGVDYWILTHKFFTNEFWAFKLTSAGIVDTVISQSGPVYGTDLAASYGQMKFSPDGTKLALGTHNLLTFLYLHDFDASTGVVSNAQDLYAPNNDQFHTYGIEFSPDNSKLYVNGRTSIGSVSTILAQYDLTAGGGNLAAINASLHILFNDQMGIMGGHALQLGPDGVIYMPSQDHQGYLSTISNPNTQGVGCNYQDSSIYLLGKSASSGLPNIIANFDYSNTTAKCWTASLDSQENSTPISYYPNPVEDALKIIVEDVESADYQLEIIDFMSKTVMSQKIEKNLSDIDLSMVESGMYLFIVKRNGIVIFTDRLLKK